MAANTISATLVVVIGRPACCRSCSLILTFAVSGLPPFSGFWAKFTLVESSLRSGYNWLAFAILLSGFLSTIAMGRVWAHAFWRGGPVGTEDGKDAEPLVSLADTVKGKIFVPVTVLVVIVSLIGLFPAPVFSIAQAGASSLLKPDAYVSSVFAPALEQKQKRAAEHGDHDDHGAHGDDHSHAGADDHGKDATKPEEGTH